MNDAYRLKPRKRIRTRGSPNQHWGDQWCDGFHGSLLVTILQEKASRSGCIECGRGPGAKKKGRDSFIHIVECVEK